MSTARKLGPQEELDDDLVEDKLAIESEKWIRGQYDFCIIHSEDDADEVASFRDEFCRKYNLEGVLESDPEMTKISSSFNRLTEMVARSTKILMYVTENFKRDNMCNLQKNELMSRHIQDPQNYSNIIPVYPAELKISAKDLSFGLSGMSGFKLFSANCDEKRVRNTFNVNIRRAKDSRKMLEDKQWKLRLDSVRRKMRRTQARQTAVESSFGSELQSNAQGINSNSRIVLEKNDSKMYGSGVETDGHGKNYTDFNHDDLNHEDFPHKVPKSHFHTTVHSVKDCQIGPVYNINVGENSCLILHSKNQIITSVQNAKHIVANASTTTTCTGSTYL